MPLIDVTYDGKLGEEVLRRLVRCCRMLLAKRSPCSYTFWQCTGQGPDQYRAVVYDIRIQDIFGQWSGWKTRTHPIWNGDFCTS